MAKKQRETPIKVKQVDTLSDENHQQLFRRLADPIFNFGAMHGTPGPRKGKSN